MKAKSFSHAMCAISWGEFPQVDCIYIHDVGVTGGLWAGGERGER